MTFDNLATNSVTSEMIFVNVQTDAVMNKEIFNYVGIRNSSPQWHIYVLFIYKIRFFCTIFGAWTLPMRLGISWAFFLLNGEYV